MSYRPLASARLPKLLPFSLSKPKNRITPFRRQLLSSSSKPPNPSKSSSSPPHPLLARLTSSRLFRPLITRILSPLRHAPVSTITSFLILHELTAIVPILTLAGLFHYTQWLPPYISEGAWVVEGVEMFGRYFRRKGWIGEGQEKEAERRVRDGRGREVQQGTGIDLAESRKVADKEVGSTKEKAGKWFSVGETGTRVVVEFATAWAVVKVLLPLRLAVSVWWAERFARRVVLPIGRAIRGSAGAGAHKKGLSATAAAAGAGEKLKRPGIQGSGGSTVSAKGAVSEATGTGATSGQCPSARNGI